MKPLLAVIVFSLLSAPFSKAEASAPSEFLAEEVTTAFEETAATAFTGQATGFFKSTDKKEFFVGTTQRGDVSRQMRPVVVFDVANVSGEIFSLRLRVVQVPVQNFGMLALYASTGLHPGKSSYDEKAFKRIGQSDVTQLRAGDDLEIDITEMVKEARATGLRKLCIQLRMEPDPVPDGITRRVGFSSVVGSTPPVLVAR